MYLIRLVVTRLTILALLTLLAACDRTPPAPGLLDLVPADTPYVFANSKALPKELTAKFLRYLELDLDSTRAQFAELREEEKALPLFTVMDALLNELDGKINEQGLAELGLKTDGHAVVYGLGLLPVVHMEISDVARLNALIDRVEQQSGQVSPQMNYEGVQYRRYDLDQMVGILAVTEQPRKMLSMALLPKVNEQTYLPLVLGLAPPEDSIAPTLAGITEAQGYTGHGEGYLDFVRVSEVLLNRGDDLHVGLWRDLSPEIPTPSQACVDLVEKTVHRVPRYLVGTRKATADEYVVSALFETDRPIAETLQRIAAPVPGLGLDTDAMFSAGMGLQLPVLREAISTVLEYFIKEGRQCDWVDVEGLRSTLPKINLALGPVSAMIKGFNLELHDLRFKEGTSELEAMDLRLLLAADDPRGIFSMLGVFSPQMSTLKVPDDGTPVQLPVEQLHATAPVSYVAIKGKALAFAVGDVGREALPEILDARVRDPAPVFTLQYDAAKLFANISGLRQLALESQPDSAQVSELEQLMMDQAAMDNYGKTFGPITTEIIATSQGLQFEQRVQLK